MLLDLSTSFKRLRAALRPQPLGPPVLSESLCPLKQPDLPLPAWVAQDPVVEHYRALLAEQPDTAFGIADRAFPHLNLLQLAAAMIEVIGHLDLLTEALAVEREQFDGAWRYRLVTR